MPLYIIQYNHTQP